MMSRFNPASSGGVCGHLPQLVAFLDLVNLSTYLLAEELITHEEWKAIQSLESRHLRVQELFYVLKTKGTGWFEKFRRALEQACSGTDVHLGHKELLRILPKTLPRNDGEASAETRNTAHGVDVELKIVLEKLRSIQNHVLYAHQPFTVCPPTCTDHRQVQVNTGRCSMHGMAYTHCSNTCTTQPTNTCMTTTASCSMTSDRLFDTGLQQTTQCSITSDHPYKIAGGHKSKGEHEVNESKSDIRMPMCVSQQLRSWKTDISKQCEAFENATTEMERKNEELVTENRRQYKEIQDLHGELRRIQEEVASQRQLLDEMKQSQEDREREVARRVEQDSRMAFDEQMKQFAWLQAAQSAEVEDVQRVKVVARQSSFCGLHLQSKKEQHIKHVKLLVVSDFQGKPRDIKGKFSRCASSIEGIIGHSLKLEPELGIMGKHEMLYSGCNVKVTLTTAELGGVQCLARLSFSPDLLVYCLDDITENHYHWKCISELTCQFTSSVWEHCVVLVQARSNLGLDSQLTRMFVSFIKHAGVSSQVYKRIPFMILPDITNTHPCLMNHYASEFYVACVEKSLPLARPALVSLNNHRLKPSSMVDFSNLPAAIHKHPLPVTKSRGEKLLHLVQAQYPSSSGQQDRVKTPPGHCRLAIRKICQL